MSQSSPVWLSLLKNRNLENIASSIECITLEDDSHSVKLAIDVIYSNFDNSPDEYSIMAKIPIADKNLDAVVNKYDLSGVRNTIAFIRMQKIRIANFEAREAAFEIRLRDLEQGKRNDEWLAKSRPGNVVEYFDRPPIGTRVVFNRNSIHYMTEPQRTKNQVGVIIANDEDGGTEIGVHWDNGEESHGLWCGKKGTHMLVYA
jgi:hypothetical protein